METEDILDPLADLKAILEAQARVATAEAALADAREDVKAAREAVAEAKAKLDSLVAEVRDGLPLFEMRVKR